MKRMRLFLLLLSASIAPAAVHAQPNCTAAELTDQQIKGIVDAQRQARSDLPPAFPDYTWEVQRRGCHYVYVEYKVPRAFHSEIRITLNQQGVIVDAVTGIDVGPPTGATESAGAAGGISCPGHSFTEAELAEIVETARQRRSDLPPPFPDSRIRVDRLRCLYLYFEYALPERKGHFQVFTIDPLGELIDVTRGDPQ